ncbi:MAG: type II toxin-antitoxin system HicA family toxin [Chloroflexota bacterium]|nr:MAG: type II toxin-antitoxin system HicA family toxin [Chloroflexota bacterium]
MPAFGPIKRRDLIRCFRQLGFEGPEPGARHQIMLKGSIRVRIPNPHEGDISPRLLSLLLGEAGVSRDEWEAL